MKRIILFFIFMFLTGSLIFTNSCRKADKIKGCTDKDSKNYDKTAQVNDGSCQYQGSVVFWYDQVASDGLVADSAVSIGFYLNGDVIGSTQAKNFWLSSPICGETGSLTVQKDLGNVKTLEYTLSVKDQTGFEYWNAPVNFAANTCIQFQLLWNKKKNKPV